MAKAYLHHSLNLLAISGEVVDTGTSKIKDRLVVRARLKVATYGKSVFVDVFGFKDTADVMSLTCDIGNQIYVEGRLANALISRGKRTRKLIPYVQATYVECLSRHRNIANIPQPEIIELLDMCDPIGYLNDTTPKRRKKETK